MFPGVIIFQRDMIGALWIAKLSPAALKKSATLSHKLRQARDAARQPLRLIGREFAGPEAVARFIVAAENPCQRDAVGVLYLIAVGRCAKGRPGRRKSAVLGT